MEKTHHKLWDKNDLLTGTGFAVTVPGVLFGASIHTVDGRNPAPPGMYKTLQIVG